MTSEKLRVPMEKICKLSVPTFINFLNFIEKDKDKRNEIFLSWLNSLLSKREVDRKDLLFILEILYTYNLQNTEIFQNIYILVYRRIENIECDDVSF